MHQDLNQINIVADIMKDFGFPKISLKVRMYFGDLFNEYAKVCALLSWARNDAHALERLSFTGIVYGG